MGTLALVCTLAALAAPQVYTLQEPAPSPRGGARIGIELAIDSEGGASLQIASVQPGSPAERAGLEPGDRLRSLDGAPLEDYAGLKQRLAGHQPGDQVELGIRREISVTLDQRGHKGEKRGPRLGVNLAEQDDSEEGGWVITHVEEGWPAMSAGLQSGDRIASAAGAQLESFEGLLEVLASIEPGEAVVLEVDRSVPIQLGGPSGAPSGEPGAPAESLEWRRLLPQYPPGDQAPGQDQPGWRYRLVPPGQTAPAPRAPPAAPAPAEPRARGEAQSLLRSELAGLQDELRGLHDELRGLREELQRLREQLEQVRRER